ncbi:MAG: 3D domain-containing protein [Candidatus Omnitrophota bacterium]|jgi:3D (Asp-Asp-Asp) domain-containing protein
MIEEKIFLNTPEHNKTAGGGRPGNKIFLVITKIVFILIFAAIAWKAYDVFWGRYCYLITAYCDCPVCINVAEFRDGKFASQRPIYWGGVATDKSVSFGSDVELVPVTPRDWLAVYKFLDGRRHFTAEDRGGKIHGRHIDIFFPQSRGGHEAALHWGVRRMRVKINGQLVS